MKLSTYASENNISYRTAYNHFKNGMIPNSTQLSNGSIFITDFVKTDTSSDIWINISDLLKNKGYTIEKINENE
jgi:hypothetical protein